MNISECTARLFQAVEEGNAQQAITELESDSGLLNATNDLGWTSLHIAASLGHTNVVELLLAKGADPNAPGHRKKTPLHRAAEGYECTLPALMLLVRAGAKIDARDSYWETPLMVAANYSNPWAVTFLLAKGARTDFRDRQGLDALGLVNLSLESAMQDRRKFRQQIRECHLIQELLALTR